MENRTFDFKGAIGNEKGMGLVEVIITAAIMMVLALAMSMMMHYQANQQKSAAAKASFNSLVLSVQNAANNPNVLSTSASALQPGGNNGGLSQ